MISECLISLAGPWHVLFFYGPCKVHIAENFWSLSINREARSLGGGNSFSFGNCHPQNAGLGIPFWLVFFNFSLVQPPPTASHSLENASAQDPVSCTTCRRSSQNCNLPTKSQVCPPDFMGHPKKLQALKINGWNMSSWRWMVQIIFLTKNGWWL